jgi:hypothetical protein
MNSSSDHDLELQRLQTLAEFEAMDTLPEAIYDRIVHLASFICGTPIALISLVDESRQWFKARVGFDLEETPKSVSFCKDAISAGVDIFEIEDARLDSRFFANPLVTGSEKVVFYAGAPLRTPNGAKLGTLCVIDHQAKQLDSVQKRNLRALADQVVYILDQQRQIRLLTERRRKELAGARKLQDSLHTLLDQQTGEIGELRAQLDQIASKVPVRPRPEKKESSSPIPLAGAKFLLALRDPAVLDSVKEALFRAGASVQVCSDLDGVAKALAQGKVQAILCELPSGYALARKFPDQSLFVVGTDPLEQRPRALLSGFREYLELPLDPLDVLAALRAPLAE